MVLNQGRVPCMVEFFCCSIPPSLASTAGSEPPLVLGPHSEMGPHAQQPTVPPSRAMAVDLGSCLPGRVRPRSGASSSANPRSWPLT